MKKRYKLVKKIRDYDIYSINYNVVNVVTQILASKVMHKCCLDEVPPLVVAFPQQRMEGVQFNRSKFLCKEFLMNYCEA